MRLATPLLVLALTLSACTGSGTTATDPGAAATSAETPSPDRDDLAITTDVEEELPALVVTADQLRDGRLSSLRPSLDGIVAAAGGHDPADLDGDRLYRWGVQYADFLDEEEPYSSDWGHHPDVVVLERDGDGFATRRARARDEAVADEADDANDANDADEADDANSADADADEPEEFHEEAWSEAASASYTSRVFEDPTPGREVADEAHLLHAALWLEVQLFDDAEAAADHVRWVATDDDERFGESYFVDVTTETLPVLDDPRVVEQTSVAARLVNNEDVSDSIEFPDALHVVRRDVAVDHLTVTVRLVGTGDDLADSTAEAVDLVLEALAEPYDPVPLIEVTRRAGDAESRLAKGLARPLAVAASTSLAAVDTHGGPYFFGLTGSDDDGPVYDHGRPGLALYDGGSELASAVISDWAAELIRTGVRVDARVYAADDEGMAARVVANVLVFESAEEADLVYQGMAVTRLEDHDATALLAESRLQEQVVVVSAEPSLPGPSDDPDEPAPGLEAIRIVARVANCHFDVEVSGVAGTDALRNLATVFVRDVLDAYDVD